MSSQPVEFWFEFASTYSYPAAHRIEAACAERGVELVWRPFLLGPIFAEMGWRDSPFNIYTAKGRYMWRDLERICAAQGLPFQRPEVFPRGGLLAARLATLAFSKDASWAPAFVREVYRANFGNDEDISDPAVVTDLLRSVGAGPPDRLIEQARAPENKDRLRAQTDQARRLGIFGAPTLSVGGELFWGQDRIDMALDAATGA